jgi:hypothetical protein
MIYKGFKFGMLLQLAIGPMCLMVFNTSATYGFLVALSLVLAIGPIYISHCIQLIDLPEADTAIEFIKLSPVKNIIETGIAAAKTEKPILAASSFGIFALLITTDITDIIIKDLGQG